MLLFYFQVLCRALSIIQPLKLESIVCVFDQAIYVKPTEIKWKEKEKFKNCVDDGSLSYIGDMNIFIKRFADACSVIIEVSVDRELCGKMYNRGIRMYKFMYEALVRVLLVHLEQQSNATLHIIKLQEIVTERPDMKNENLNQLSEASDVNEAYPMFTDIRFKMNDKNNSSTLHRFWIALSK